MGRFRTLVVIPAFNEAESLPKVLDNLANFNLLVVDDGSTDDTFEVSRRMGVSVIRLADNQGYDTALAAGIIWAIDHSYEAIVTCDADGQHSQADVENLSSFLTSSASLVVGQRPGSKRFSEKLFSVYSRSRWGIEDPMCGLKAYLTRDIPYDVLALMQGTIGSGLAIAMVRNGVSVRNVPISGLPRLSGNSRFGLSWRANLSILKGLLRVAGRDLHWIRLLKV